jgi:hypothetical protein
MPDCNEIRNVLVVNNGVGEKKLVKVEPEQIEAEG